ncbi:MAG: C25 family cysteine peptidase [Anaerolineae bacterium]
MDRNHQRSRALTRLFVLLAIVLLPGVLAGRVASTGLPARGQGQWLAFDGRAAPAAPLLIVLQADSTSIALDADMPGAWTEMIRERGEVLTGIGGEGYGHGEQVGLPDLPVLRGTVEVPAGAQVMAEVLIADTIEASLTELGLHTIYPLQAPVPKLPRRGEPLFAMERAFYASDLWYPQAPVRVGVPHEVRGHRLVTVEVWPVAYNPAQARLRLTRHLTLRLRLQGGNVVESMARQRRLRSRVFDARLAGQVLNHDLGRAEMSAQGDTPLGYLIIAADGLYTSTLPLAALQTSRGFSVTLTTLSQIGTALTSQDIRQYVLDAYHMWDLPPTYLLLVGDTDTIPTWLSQSGQQAAATDLYYATMDGAEDWHPDILVGRWPVRTPSQMSALVEKHLAYAGLAGSEPWLRRAAFVATNDYYYYWLAEATHNYVIDGYTSLRGYTGSFPADPQLGGDRLYARAYGASGAQVLASVSAGRGVVIYSGHGSYTSWAWPYVDVSGVHALANAGQYPFVASHACYTGNYALGGTLDTESLGEAWLRKSGGGAIAFWGSTDLTYWYHDDLLEKAMFDRLYDCGRPMPTIGEITEAALAQVELAYPYEARYYREEYNLLGDPSLILAVPEAQPPQVNAVSPSSGSFLSRVPITVQGAGYCGGARVYLGSTELVPVEWQGPTTLSTWVPRNTPGGVYDLTVRNGDGQEATLTGAYTVTADVHIYRLPLVFR